MDAGLFDPPAAPPLPRVTAREWSFIGAALADAADFPLFLVLADYLEENGRTAEGARVRRLVPKAGELLVATTPPADPDGPDDPDEKTPGCRLLEALAHAVRSACPAGGPSLLVLPHGTDLRSLGEEEMAALGWVPAARVREAWADGRRAGLAEAAALVEPLAETNRAAEAVSVLIRTLASRRPEG